MAVDERHASVLVLDADALHLILIELLRFDGYDMCWFGAAPHPPVKCCIHLSWGGGGPTTD